MADLTAPLRALCQKSVVFAYVRSQQEAFEPLRKKSQWNQYVHILIHERQVPSSQMHPREA